MSILPMQVDVGNFLRLKSCVLYTELENPAEPLINVEVVAHVTQPELRSSEVSTWVDMLKLAFAKELGNEMGRYPLLFLLVLGICWSKFDLGSCSAIWTGIKQILLHVLCPSWGRERWCPYSECCSRYGGGSTAGDWTYGCGELPNCCIVNMQQGKH